MRTDGFDEAGIFRLISEVKTERRQQIAEQEQQRENRIRDDDGIAVPSPCTSKPKVVAGSQEDVQRASERRQAHWDGVSALAAQQANARLERLEQRKKQLCAEKEETAAQRRSDAHRAAKRRSMFHSDVEHARDQRRRQREMRGVYAISAVRRWEKPVLEPLERRQQHALDMRQRHWDEWVEQRQQGSWGPADSSEARREASRVQQIAEPTHAKCVDAVTSAELATAGEFSRTLSRQSLTLLRTLSKEQAAERKEALREPSEDAQRRAGRSEDAQRRSQDIMDTFSSCSSKKEPVEESPKWSSKADADEEHWLGGRGRTDPKILKARLEQNENQLMADNEYRLQLKKERFNSNYAAVQSAQRDARDQKAHLRRARTQQCLSVRTQSWEELASRIETAAEEKNVRAQEKVKELTRQKSVQLEMAKDARMIRVNDHSDRMRAVHDFNRIITVTQAALDESKRKEDVRTALEAKKEKARRTRMAHLQRAETRELLKQKREEEQQKASNMAVLLQGGQVATGSSTLKPARSAQHLRQLEEDDDLAEISHQSELEGFLERNHFGAFFRGFSSHSLSRACVEETLENPLSQRSCTPEQLEDIQLAEIKAYVHSGRRHLPELGGMGHLKS